jgi:hypothetical protein
VAIPPGTVVATGTFVARGGQAASGALSVVASAEPGSFELVPDGVVGPDRAELTLLPRMVGSDETCADTGFRYSFGSIASFGQTPLMILPDLTRGDPSFFRTAVITLYSDAARDQEDCLASIVATASLAWTMPDDRPDLVVTDSGSSVGAIGAVVSSSDGSLTYAVAAGDTLSNIAERFGITVDDLFYLNPARLPSPQNPTAFAGEVLNLSKAAR